MKNKKIIIGIFIFILFLVGCSTEKEIGNKEILGETVKIEDVRGREVEITRPIDRAYYPYYHENLLTIVGPDAYSKVVCTSVYDTKAYSRTTYEAFENNVKGFKDIIDVGTTLNDDFQLEKLIEIKPDIVILADYQYEAFGENNIKTLEKLGIPVIVIDFTDLTQEGHYKSTRILGKIFGVEDRAEELIENYKMAVSDVENRLKDIKEDERKTVYIEMCYGFDKYEDYGGTYGDYMIGHFIENVKGINIYKDIYKTSGESNAEYVLEKNPDIIVLDSGNYFDENKDTVSIGITISEEDAQKTGNALVKARLGWDKLNAVKNGDVYILDNETMRTLRDYTLIQYLGKALYLERFEDMDPVKNNEEFLEKYVPDLSIDGTFMTKLEIR